MINGTFYEGVERLSDGQINWDSVTESLMTVFKNANKDIERYIKQDDNLMDEALILFNQTQFNFGQSF
ncbi:hypothetical protein CRYPA_943 [uncultured Candidatus Thioglobus sp.]|nr:hypothetical protein CRYPA_943 [uncultured Candidatus Thioglobus sp.]